MNAPTSTTFPLDGLLICGQCGEPMRINDDLEPRYVCETECSTPSLRAGGVDMMLIGRVLETVLTPMNTATVLRTANKELAEESGGQLTMTGRDIEELSKRPDLLVQAAGSASETQYFLSQFIKEIQVHAGRAVVRYSIPLPADSPLAGMVNQEIELPPDLTLSR